ncbi:hypothetical protein Tcan_07948 [Toxocara canis]|uniref:Uncharacterized protein n=1 Tax=Toxocara canis TaxID=6265 RepID=A0A0B2VET2_TOXCA|nr:hypothetical protein Tcan_07948 [Toxocara canis]
MERRSDTGTRGGTLNAHALLVIGSNARLMSSSSAPNRFRVSSVGQSNHELRLEVPTPVTTPNAGEEWRGVVIRVPLQDSCKSIMFAERSAKEKNALNDAIVCAMNECHYETLSESN